MKKFLLTILVIISASWLFVLHAQNNEIPSDGLWKHQPTKTETWLYNTAIFDFESGSGSEADSIPETTTEFEFETDKIISLTSAWMDAEWMMDFRTEIYLKNETEIDSMVMSLYDATEKEWMRSTKIVNEYNGDVQSESRIYSADSITGEWQLFSQTDFEYNSSGFKTAEIMSTFMPDSNRLVTTSKTDYFTNSEGRIDSTKNFFNMPVLGWALNSQTNYYYSSNGNLDYQETMISNFISPTLLPSSKTNYSYNSEGNQNVQTNYSWNPVAMDYTLESKDSTVYQNENRPLVEIHLQKPLIANELLVYQKTFFTYDTPSSVPGPVQKSSVVVYPNPVSDILNISTNSFGENHIRIFDLNGKIIFEKSVTADKTQIPVKNFNNGSYLLQVSSPEGVDSKIIVIQ